MLETADEKLQLLHKYECLLREVTSTGGVVATALAEAEADPQDAAASVRARSAFGQLKHAKDELDEFLRSHPWLARRHRRLAPT